MFKRIDVKILVVIGMVVSLGLIALVMFYSEREEQNILAQNKRTLIKVVESADKSLKTLMLSGYGDIGAILAESLNNLSEMMDISVMRVDGSAAFLDNQTINQVNEKVGYEQFYPRDEESQRQVLPERHSSLQEVVESGRLTEYYDVTSEGERIYTLLAPISVEPACGACHEDSSPVRGVIKLTTSLKKVDADIAASRWMSLAVLCIALLLIMFSVSVFVRRNVLPPIQLITRAMRKASNGDLRQKIPVPAHTELATMAESFNRMTAELDNIYAGLHRERNKLSTIILGAQEGMIATDADGQVVLVNPAAEALMGRSFAEIVHAGIASTFEDHEWVLDCLSQVAKRQKRTNLLRFRDKLLSVQIASIDNVDGRLIGTAVLIRDVTQEQELTERLKHQSRTDPLTGLFNRRYFDEQMHKEFRLSQRYGHSLSVILFDVDHFKRFNDTYGHDQGDRVLQHVARTVQQQARSVDIVCRYGGEEFVVILPDQDADAATRQAERFRKGLESMSVNGLQVTASFGVASVRGGQPSDPKALIQAADKALYVAKAEGRNRVRLAEAERAQQVD